MEAIQVRHNRFGLSAGCNLLEFGNYETCTNGDDDNNGLWTSLVVAAESFRYAVTGAADALDTALSLYGGMRLLNIITGVPGLMARTVLAPNETHPGGPDWYNSTVPGYEGWVWQHNTSSDQQHGVHPTVACGWTLLVHVLA